MAVVVMIGVDTHKGSHTAVAIDAAEVPLGQLRVRASAAQAGKLLEWAADWPDRTWAVEGVGGLGHVLAQQLVAAGEQVLDVQPKLGAPGRLLSSGTSNKNDPNDARSVAVAALRSRPASRSALMTTRSCCGFGPAATASCPRCAPRPPAGSTPCCARSFPAAFPRSSPRPALPRSLTRTARPAPPRKPGTTWPTSTLLTCAASTPSSARHARSSPWPSAPPAPA
jgi:Transposase